MEDRRLFQGDRLGAAVFGAVFGSAIALFEWWGSFAFTHDTRWAVIVGIAFTFAASHRAYRIGVRRGLAAAALGLLVLGALLVLRPFDPGVGVDHFAEAAVVLAIGLVGFGFAVRVTPEQAERLRPYWATGGPIWSLPLPLARLVSAVLALGICGFALAALLWTFG